MPDYLSQESSQNTPMSLTKIAFTHIITKSLSEFLPRGIDVPRTGIELYMIISKLPYLQAVLQAVRALLYENKSSKVIWL